MNSTNVLTSDGTGRPRRCAIQTPSGSIVADTSGGGQHLARRRRQDHRPHEDDDGVPRDVSHRRGRDRPRLRIDQRHEDRIQDHEQKADVGLRLRRERRVADEQEHRGRDGDAENVDDHGQRPGRRSHREREDDGVHDEAEQPEACSHRAGHGDALDVFGEQIIGKPGRRGPHRCAWQRRLHAGLDDFLLRVRHGCPV